MKKHLIKLVTAITLIAIIATLAFTGCEEEAEYSLKITAIGEGTTSPAPGTYTKTEGESVTVTATPATGYELDRWEGDVSGTDDSITFKMTSDKSVVAVFVEEEPVWEWPDSIKVFSGASGTVGYAALAGWTPLLQEDTGMKVRIVPEISFAVKTRCLKQGEYFFAAMAPDAECAQVMKAETGFATRDGGPFQMRIVWTASKTGAGFVVSGDSDIKTVYDIEPGAKIAWMTFGGQTAKDYMLALLAWAGLSEDDVEWVPVANPMVMYNVITEGTADVTLGFPDGALAVEAEASPHGLYWIPLDPEEDPEGAARFLEIRPLTSFFVNTSGVASSIGVPMFGGIATDITSAETDPELVYNVVKWLHENFDQYKDVHAWCKFMDLDTVMEVVETSYIPAHEGLVRYLEEIGVWTDAHEARQAENIAFMTQYCDAWEAAIEEADDQGIDVDPENEEWMNLWQTYLDQLPSLKMYTGI
jgi:TRAP transporter TAXI family solute receptor